MAQTVALVTAENQQAQGEAVAGVAGQSQAVTDSIAAGATESQLLLAQAQAALAAGQQSAVAQDEQLDAGLADAINGAVATNAGELANLTAGVAAQQGAVATRTAVQQALVQAQSVALGKANGQRAGNWNAAAGQLFESVGKAIELEVVQTANKVLQGINTTLNVAMVGEIFGGEGLEPVTGGLRLVTDGLAAGAEAMEVSEQAALDAAGGSLSAGVPGVAVSFVPAAAADGAATGLAGVAENVAAVASTAADNAVANGIIQAGEQAGAEGVVNADELAVNAWENEGGALAQVEGDLSGTTLARQLGQEGERAAGIVKNTERINSLTGTARYRVPDLLDDDAKIIGDVKNVGRLSYTNQLEDFAAYAKQFGYNFELIVRQGTVLSRALQQLVDQGDIILRRLLP